MFGVGLVCPEWLLWQSVFLFPTQATTLMGILQTRLNMMFMGDR